MKALKRMKCTKEGHKFKQTNLTSIALRKYECLRCDILIKLILPASACYFSPSGVYHRWDKSVENLNCLYSPCPEQRKVVE